MRFFTSTQSPELSLCYRNFAGEMLVFTLPGKSFLPKLDSALLLFNLAESGAQPEALLNMICGACKNTC